MSPIAFNNFRFTFFRRFTSFDFDWNSKILTSTGQYDWQATLMEAPVYDPLNVQVELRKRLMLGDTEFTLMLPEIKTGQLIDNTYATERTCRVNCKCDFSSCTISYNVKSDKNY